MPRQRTTLESAGAEFLVLGQLLIEGIPAYKTYTNLLGYDLAATWPETNRSARIQVKSRWATDARHILVKNLDFDFLVLVGLNRGYLKNAAKSALPPEDPESYVLTKEEAEGLLVDRDTAWPKIPWNEEQLKPHRRRWGIVRDFLEIPEEPKNPKAK
ncbi:MAG: hypothetical protein ABSC22_11170 [Roseiarcus sp.]|jgi:hypothetical protein